MSKTKYISVRVVQKHKSYLNPVPWQLIKLNRENQLTWGVIKFLIAKNIGQFKNKSYSYDIDGKYYEEYGNVKVNNFTVEDNILNNSCIIYSLVPIHYKEKTHFIPYNAIDFTMDIDEKELNIQFY